MSGPILRRIANLWTLMGHPSKESEWPLEQKLRAIKEAGFDGVCWAGSPELCEGTKRNGLIFVGGMASGRAGEFSRLLREQKDCGAVLSCWLEGNRAGGREIFVCPELGPVEGGYGLSTFPNSWEDAKILRGEIERLWEKVAA